MKLGLINSAFSQVGMDFEEGIQHAKEIGFDTIDVFTEAWQISGAEKRLIAEVCTAHDLPQTWQDLPEWTWLELLDSRLAMSAERCSAPR